MIYNTPNRPAENIKLKGNHVLYNFPPSQMSSLVPCSGHQIEYKHDMKVWSVIYHQCIQIKNGHTFYRVFRVVIMTWLLLIFASKKLQLDYHATQSFWSSMYLYPQYVQLVCLTYIHICDCYWCIYLLIDKAICILDLVTLQCFALVFALEDLSLYPNQCISGALVNLILTCPNSIQLTHSKLHYYNSLPLQNVIW